MGGGGLHFQQRQLESYLFWAAKYLAPVMLVNEKCKSDIKALGSTFAITYWFRCLNETSIFYNYIIQVNSVILVVYYSHIPFYVPTRVSNYKSGIFNSY